MRLVTQPFRFWDGELALVARACGQIGGWCERRCSALFGLAPLVSKMLPDRVLPAAVVTRRPRDGSRIIRMETDTAIRLRLPGLRERGLLHHLCPAVPVEFKPERLAKGGERPFGGVGFRGLEGNVVDLAREVPRPSPVPWPSRTMVVRPAFTVTRTRAR